MPSVRMTYLTCFEDRKFRQDGWNRRGRESNLKIETEAKKDSLGAGCLALVLFEQRFLNRKLTAGAPDQFPRGGILQKLEAEAKCVSLPRHRQHFHLSGWKRELQPNHLTQWHFVSQHGGDSRLADVDRLAIQHSLTASIDFDRHSQLVAGTPPVFHNVWSPISCSMLSSHAAAFSRWNCPASQANRAGKSQQTLFSSATCSRYFTAVPP